MAGLSEKGNERERKQVDLTCLAEVFLQPQLGQCRAVPVQLGEGYPRAFLAVYGADAEIDPYVEMFFFPTDTLKMALILADGSVLWRKDLGRGVVPGLWFCPVFPFDLNGDGVDEIWYVGNSDADHPLGVSHYRLECLDARTGDELGSWPWPNAAAARNQNLSHGFRNFILGGYVHGTPVLLTAQGTYGDMFFQGWDSGMRERWTHHVSSQAPGARGSHMCPVTDLDGDGVDEVMWGERCIELGTGREVFCADEDSYRGHSDIIQPVYDWESGRWYFYTCREGELKVAPRVALYNHKGQRVWGQLDAGHIDTGWVARLGVDAKPIAMAIRIGHKMAGPQGLRHQGVEEFVYDALTGESMSLRYSVYGTFPVDVDGDGYHELVNGRYTEGGTVIDRTGRVLGATGGRIAMLSKFLDLPGEQLLCWYPDGRLRIWADKNAADTPAATARYNHHFYQVNQRLFAVGYNLPVLGGI